jgi:hypothetical protein
MLASPSIESFLRERIESYGIVNYGKEEMNKSHYIKSICMSTGAKLFTSALPFEQVLQLNSIDTQQTRSTTRNGPNQDGGKGKTLSQTKPAQT